MYVVRKTVWHSWRESLGAWRLCYLKASSTEYFSNRLPRQFPAGFGSSFISSVPDVSAPISKVSNISMQCASMNCLPRQTTLKIPLIYNGVEGAKEATLNSAERGQRSADTSELKRLGGASCQLWKEGICHPKDLDFG